MSSDSESRPKPLDEPPFLVNHRTEPPILVAEAIDSPRFDQPRIDPQDRFDRQEEERLVPVAECIANPGEELRSALNHRLIHRNAPLDTNPSPRSGNGKNALMWWLLLPFRLFYRIFQFASLVALLAVASSIPILQLAALGYMLEVGRRISLGTKGVSLLPGLDRATRIGVIAAGTALCWLPVWLVSDYAYSAELIESGSKVAYRWHIAAWIFSIAWIVHVGWAAMRGGRWYHFLWPAPVRFMKEILQRSTWTKAEDGLWQYTVGLQIPRLTWLGLRGAIVGLVWLALPATMMIAGIQANQQPGRVLIGVVGAFLMMIVLLYLPFLQIHMARENRFRAGWDIRSIRAQFQRAPWAFFIALFVTFGMSLPLFLFRIESLPKELLWLPCLFFVLLTFPARALTGWALYRGGREIPKRWWLSRWSAWTLELAIAPIYLLFLYLASIASWDGRLIFFIQHAFLVPVPFAGN